MGRIVCGYDQSEHEAIVPSDIGIYDDVNALRSRIRELVEEARGKDGMEHWTLGYDEGFSAGQIGVEND